MSSQFLTSLYKFSHSVLKNRHIIKKNQIIASMEEHSMEALNGKNRDAIGHKYKMGRICAVSWRAF